MTDVSLSDVVMQQYRGNIGDLPATAEDGRILVVKDGTLRILYVGTGTGVSGTAVSVGLGAGIVVEGEIVSRPTSNVLQPAERHKMITNKNAFL